MIHPFTTLPPADPTKLRSTLIIYTIGLTDGRRNVEACARYILDPEYLDGYFAGCAERKAQRHA